MAMETRTYPWPTMTARRLSREDRGTPVWRVEPRIEEEYQIPLQVIHRFKSTTYHRSQRNAGKTPPVVAVLKGVERYEKEWVMLRGIGANAAEGTEGKKWITFKILVEMPVGFVALNPLQRLRYWISYPFLKYKIRDEAEAMERLRGGPASQWRISVESAVMPDFIEMMLVVGQDNRVVEGRSGHDDGDSIITTKTGEVESNGSWSVEGNEEGWGKMDLEDAGEVLDSQELEDEDDPYLVKIMMLA